MILRFALPAFVVASVSLIAPAQEEQVEQAEEVASAAANLGFGGPLSQRLKLTGDWGGVRDEMALKGLTIDLDVTHISQWLVQDGLDGPVYSRRSSTIVAAPVCYPPLGWWCHYPTNGGAVGPFTANSVDDPTGPADG